MNVLSKVFVDVRELVVPVCVAVLRILRLDRIARVGTDAAKTLLAPWPLWPSRYNHSKEDARTIKAIEDEAPSSLQQQEGGQSPREDQAPSTGQSLSPCTVDDKGVPTYEALYEYQTFKPTIVEEVKFPGIDVDEQPEEKETAFDVVFGAMEKAVMKTAGRVQDVVENVVAPPFMETRENHDAEGEKIMEEIANDEERVLVGMKRKDSSVWDGEPTCPKRPKAEQNATYEAVVAALSPGPVVSDVQAEDTEEPIELEESDGLATAVVDKEQETEEGNKQTLTAQPTTPLDHAASRAHQEKERVFSTGLGDSAATVPSLEDALPRWEASSVLTAPLEDQTDSQSMPADVAVNEHERYDKMPSLLPRVELTEDAVRGSDDVGETKEATVKAPLYAASWEESSGLAMPQLDSATARDKAESIDDSHAGPLGREEPSGLETAQAQDGLSASPIDGLDVPNDQPQLEESSGLADLRRPEACETLPTSSASRVPREDLSALTERVGEREQVPATSTALKSFGQPHTDDRDRETETERVAPSGMSAPTMALAGNKVASAGSAIQGLVSDRESAPLRSARDQERSKREPLLSGNETGADASMTPPENAIASEPKVHDVRPNVEMEDTSRVCGYEQRDDEESPFEESSGLAVANGQTPSVSTAGFVPTPTQEIAYEATTPLAKHDSPVAAEMDEHSMETVKSRTKTPSWMRAPSYEVESAAADGASSPLIDGTAMPREFDSAGEEKIKEDATMSSRWVQVAKTPGIHSLALTSPLAAAFTMALRGPTETFNAASSPLSPFGFGDLLKPGKRVDAATEQAASSDSRTRCGSNDTEDTESDRHLEDVDSTNEEAQEPEEGGELAIRDAQGKVVGVLAHVVKVDEVVMDDADEEHAPQKETKTATKPLVMSESAGPSSDDAWSSDDCESDDAFTSVPPTLGKRVITAVYFTV